MFAYKVQRTQTTQVRNERGATDEYLRTAVERQRSFFVTDRQVMAARPCVSERLPSDRTLIVESSEPAKTIVTLETILVWMQSVGMLRRDTLVVVGGGVLMDVGGLAAALYLRGVDYQLLPTSMVAQVDASIGGKVGLNFGDSKNSIGSFWHPSAVIIDTEHLGTVSDRDYRAGLAECVKVALCQGSSEFFEMLEEHVAEVLRRDGSVVDHVVAESVRIKWDLLADDPFEVDLDRLLNLGHTTAHALERATNFARYLHGEAVSVGLATAARYSCRSGMLASIDLYRIESLLDRLGLPISVAPDLIEPMRSALGGVKRVRDGKFRLVVPVSIGSATVLEPPDSDFLLGALG